jgi:hypothetical protein
MRVTSLDASMIERCHRETKCNAGCNRGLAGAGRLAVTQQRQESDHVHQVLTERRCGSAATFLSHQRTSTGASTCDLIAVRPANGHTTHRLGGGGVVKDSGKAGAIKHRRTRRASRWSSVGQRSHRSWPGCGRRALGLPIRSCDNRQSKFEIRSSFIWALLCFGYDLW